MVQLIDFEAVAAAQAALESSPLYALRQIRVEYVNDSILLSGRVESYYLKQQAQESVRDACLDVQVKNAIDVVEPMDDEWEFRAHWSEERLA